MKSRQRERVYLDYLNGGALAAPVTEAMELLLGGPDNPSSPHAEGRRAAQQLERARAKVAALIGARSEEIVFTSSGTEANAWALAGLAKPRCSRPCHVVVSAVEHLSVLQTVRQMEREGWSVSFVPVDRFGMVDPARVEEAMRPETALVSIQWANGEVGTLQPVGEIARRVKGRGALFHTDAVAAAGSVPVDTREGPVDALSLASAPLGGPPGAGALFIRRGTRIVPWLLGGAQEGGRRAGTENLIGIAGMGEAAALAAADLVERGRRWAALRDRLIEGVLRRIPAAGLNGHPTRRLPGHASFSFPGVEAEALALALDLEGIAVGLGSACSSTTMKASHVLKAMGVEERRALGTITCTIGAGTSESEIDRFLEALPKTVEAQSTTRKETVTA